MSNEYNSKFPDVNQGCNLDDFEIVDECSDLSDTEDEDYLSENSEILTNLENNSFSEDQRLSSPLTEENKVTTPSCFSLSYDECDSRKCISSPAVNEDIEDQMKGTDSKKCTLSLVMNENINEDQKGETDSKKCTSSPVVNEDIEDQKEETDSKMFTSSPVVNEDINRVKNEETDSKKCTLCPVVKGNINRVKNEETDSNKCTSSPVVNENISEVIKEETDSKKCTLSPVINENIEDQKEETDSKKCKSSPVINENINRVKKEETDSRKFSSSPVVNENIEDQKEETDSRMCISSPIVDKNWEVSGNDNLLCIQTKSSQDGQLDTYKLKESNDCNGTFLNENNQEILFKKMLQSPSHPSKFSLGISHDTSSEDQIVADCAESEFNVNNCKQSQKFDSHSATKADDALKNQWKVPHCNSSSPTELLTNCLPAVEDILCEIPGEEIIGASFKRVILVGNSCLKALHAQWPSDSDFKPYILHHKEMKFNKLTSEVFKHQYVTRESGRTLIVVIVGIQELIQVGRYNSSKCSSQHSPILVPYSCALKNHSELLSLLNEMQEFRDRMKNDKSADVVYSFLPKYNLVKNVKTIFDLRKQNGVYCNCTYDRLESRLKRVNRELNELSLNFNQLICLKRLNRLHNHQVFEYLPPHFSFLNGDWTFAMSNSGSTKKDQASGLKAVLKKTIYSDSLANNYHLSESELKYIQDESKFIDNYIVKNYNDFKVILAGDSWLKAVYDFWPENVSQRPLIYYRDNISFDDMKNFVLSSVSEDEKVVIIVSIPSAEFLVMKPFIGCKGHSPVRYPVPNPDLLDKPSKLFCDILKKTTLFYKEIKNKLKKSKIIFTTCYPIIFEMYYKYLCDLHAKTVGHIIDQRFVQPKAAKRNRRILKAFMNYIAKYLMKMNEYGDITTHCDINKCMILLSEPRFVYPLYVPHLSPDNYASEKLYSLVKRYINTLIEINRKEPFSWNALEDPKNIVQVAKNCLTDEELIISLQCPNALEKQSRVEFSSETIIDTSRRQHGGRQSRVGVSSETIVETSRKQHGGRQKIDGIKCDPNSRKKKMTVRSVSDDKIGEKLSVRSKLAENVFEMPGVDITDEPFSRIVIVGNTALTGVCQNWPTDCGIKPYFLCLKTMYVDSLSKRFCQHEYFNGDGKILVLVSVGPQEILSKKKYKNMSCTSGHDPISFPYSMTLDSQLKLCELLNEMEELKANMEVNKSLSVVFSYMPEFDLIGNIEDAFEYVRGNYKVCSCSPHKFTDGFNEINKTYKEFVRNFNQIIKLKKLNFVGERSLEYHPLPLSFIGNQWCLKNKDDFPIGDHIGMLSISLKTFIFKSKECNMLDKNDLCVFNRHSEYISELVVRNYNDFKVVLVGDSWLKAVYNFWNQDVRERPLILYQDEISFAELKKLIFSSISVEEKVLIVLSIPSTEFLDYKLCSECVGHTPLRYSVPHSKMYSCPGSLFSHILRKIASFHEDVKSKLRNCKIVYTSCYPIVFEMYYKHLTEKHVEITGHLIENRLIAPQSSRANRRIVKSFMYVMDKFLTELNTSEGYSVLCDVNKMMTSLSEPRFVYPLYIPSISPDLFASKKLSSLLREYITTCLNQNIPESTSKGNNCDIKVLCNSFIENPEIAFALQSSSALEKYVHGFHSEPISSCDQTAFIDTSNSDYYDNFNYGETHNEISETNSYFGESDFENFVYPSYAGNNELNSCGSYTSNTAASNGSCYRNCFQGQSYAEACSPSTESCRFPFVSQERDYLESSVSVRQPSSERTCLEERHNYYCECYRRNPSTYSSHCSSRSSSASLEPLSAAQGYSMFDPNLRRMSKTDLKDPGEFLKEEGEKKLHNVSDQRVNRKKRTYSDDSIDHYENTYEPQRKRKKNSRHKYGKRERLSETTDSNSHSVDMGERKHETCIQDVTSILSQIAHKLGENLGPSLVVLHKEISKSVENHEDPLNHIDSDARMLLELVSDKLHGILSNGDLPVIQRAIYQEASTRLSHFLQSLKTTNKAEERHGLDIQTIAKVTMHKDAKETIHFIKNTLAYTKIDNVSSEKIMDIYSEVRMAQVNMVIEKQ